ncbi:hypothetical protein M501DRAFT_998977 [Patellaria atrata CBS 101060]|uniref:Uncharacterized protein n=1 Tax=Patellaria atrata CBS 101060 TaxID=1346257 RepID=A0A9P4VLG1_9PEZI|nr:hypothetical protein M501DRAFT_998977 [Patellaria atrata CBS 101060]
MDSKNAEVIDHFLSVISPNSIPLDIRHQSDLLRSGWLTLAFSSRAFMHSFLCGTAVHMCMLGRRSYYDIMYHRAQAIAEIRANISNPELALDDANIGAVFGLLCVEESLPLFQKNGEHDEDSSSQRLTHLSGLKRMLELRGGLHALSTNKCLQALILWHSTAHAIASFYPPYTPLPDNYGTLTSATVLSDKLISQPLGTIALFCRLLRVNEDVVNIAADLSRYTSALDSWFEEDDSSLDPAALQNHANILNRRLLRHLTKESLRPLDETLCISLLIFTFRISETGYRSFDPLHFTAIKRLQQAIIRTSSDDWYESPGLLLWVLVIGAICAQGSSESSWFVYQVSVACAEYDINSYDELVSRLQQCLWSAFTMDSIPFS